MTEAEWSAFTHFRDEFKESCIDWLHRCGYEYRQPGQTQTAADTASSGAVLHLLQKEAAEADGIPCYPVETPLVYNHSLDDIRRNDTIKLVIISDNPGKNEQLHRNQRYLVGQAGKVAESFFTRHPELGIRFRQDVLLLNKTPVHTAKTKQLHAVLKRADTAFYRLFEETQILLARRTAALQKQLGCGLWLVGYGELRKKALFTAYAEELKACYDGACDAPVRVFQHFSMNCFSNDLKKNYDNDKTLAENLAAIGLSHRRTVLGW